MPLVDCLGAVANALQIKEVTDKVDALVKKGKHQAEAEAIAKREFVSDEFGKLNDELNGIKKEVGVKAGKAEKLKPVNFSELNKKYKADKEAATKDVGENIQGDNKVVDKGGNKNVEVDELDRIAKDPQKAIDKYYENNSGLDLKDAANDWMVDDIKNAITKTNEFIQSDGKKKLYRAVVIKNGKEVDAGNTGVHFVKDKSEITDDFLAKIGINRNDFDKVHVMEVSVENKDIDIGKTLFHNINHPSELEITLKDKTGANPDNISAYQAPKKEQQKPEKQKDNSVVGETENKKQLSSKEAFKQNHGVDFDEFDKTVEKLKKDESRYGNPIEKALLEHGIVDNRAVAERNPAYSDYVKIKLEEPLPKKLPTNKEKINVAYADDFKGNINVQPLEQKVKPVEKSDKGSIASISKNTSKDDLRPAMTGVYLDAENKKMVATDAHKLVWIDTPNIKESKIINPKTGATIDAKFPDYKAVIPEDNPIKVKGLSIGDLLNQTNGIDRANKIISGKELLAVIKIGDTNYAFDPKLLNDVLTTFAEHGAKKIDFDLSKPTRAMILSSKETPKVHGLLMPKLFEEEEGLSQAHKLIYERESTKEEKQNVIQADINSLNKDLKIEKKKVSDATAMLRKAKNNSDMHSAEWEIEYHGDRVAELEKQVEQRQSDLKILDNPLQEEQDLQTVKENISDGNITSEAATDFIKAANEQSEKVEPIIKDIESKAESDNEADLNEAIQKADELITQPINTETDTKIRNADISNGSLHDDKNVGEYVAKAKSVLETLYPKAKLEVYDNTKDYVNAGGDEYTRGIAFSARNGNHRILLNLEQIKNDNSGKTAFHEVIHPIVFDAFGVKKEDLIPIWNRIATEMEKVKGMEKVFDHVSAYPKDIVAAEGLTELLTQVAAGNIDLSSVPRSTGSKIIDLINKLFDALGINITLKSVEDFHNIANRIKTAFDTGSGEALRDIIKGHKIDKYVADLAKSKDISQEQYKEKIEKLKSLGYSDEDIKAAFKRKGIAEEKVNEILSQTKTENDAIKEGEQPEGNIAEHQDRESGGKATETSGSNSPIGSGEKQQGQKEVGGEPPKEPPKTGEFSSLPQKERVRGAYQHLINSDIPKDIKEKMEKEGLSPKGTSISYKVADNEESQKVGKATIQSFGVDEALSLARQGTFHPSVNSSVFAEAINHFQELESNAKTSAEKLDYAQKWADTYDEYAQQLTGAGQFSQYAYQYYKTSKLGFVISAERKFNDRRDYFTGKAEKNLKSIIEDIENEPEFQEYLKGKVADEYFKDKGVKNKVVAKLNDTAAKIRKEGLGSILPSWAKADVGGAQKQSIGGKTLDDIVATSLETIAKGIEAGEKIGDLVRDAISNIKSGGATANDKEISDWLYGQFKGTQKDATESYKERLRNQIKDLDEQITNKERKQKEIKKTDYDDETKDLIKERDEKKKQLNEVAPLQKSAEKILQKWDKKLSNLDPEKRKELLQKVLTEITQNGGLDLDTFKSMYADALGLPSLTPEMRTKLLELGARLNSVDKATEELSKNPTQENIDAYLKSMQDGEKASSEINDLFGEKGITLDRFLNIAKLNTLGVANLVMNPLYNINFMPVRFAESLVKTGLDYGLKYMGFARDADGVYENALYKQFGYYGGFKQGLQKSIHDVVRGQTQIDYFKKTTRQNIRPLTSLKELISHYKGQNPLTKAEVVNAMVEAFPTMGASAAVISRALQVGDLPFRFAAERAMAENIARQKGLSGIQKDAFVLNPNEESKKLITDAGERAVMQQDNELTKLITRLSSAFKYAGGESRATKVLSGIGKVIGATTQPFVKIPLNSAMSVLELAVPEFSAAKGIYHAINGERDLALNAFSRMAVGIAIGAAYSQIAQAGLISSTSNSPDKINASIAKEDVYGGNDLNYSAFLRWMSGGGAGWKNDDTFLNLNAFGVSGNIMALYGAKYDKMPPDQWNKLSYLDGLSNRVSSSFIDGLKNNVFSNTSTLIDAMSSGNAYSVNKWLRGSSNVLLNSFDPSWLSMASKLKNDFKVDYTAMSLKDQMASTLKERFWNKDDLPKQITVWGEDRKLTPNGANPLLYYYADVTKSRNLDSRDFGYNILSLYNRTKDDSVIPSRPQKTIRADNQSKQLNPKEYEQLQILVGQSRKAQAQAMMTGQFRNEEGDMVSFNELNDEQKIKILDKTYKKGYEIGKKQFLIKNPGFFQNDKK